MIDKKIIVTTFKGVGQKLLFYIKTELLEEVKNVCLKACEEVKNFVWEKIKADVKTCAAQIIKDAESFLASAEAEEKKKAILDAIMAKIELPLILKPFKGIVRNIIKGKLEDLIKTVLDKGKELVG